MLITRALWILISLPDTTSCDKAGIFVIKAFLLLFRPLPDELLKYAREDTHCLLYIYDMLKNELIERGNEHKNLLVCITKLILTFLFIFRPLPDELLKYAREDTHYLLYIYDMLKNELIERGNEHKNLLLSVLQRSKHIAAKVSIIQAFR